MIQIVINNGGKCKEELKENADKFYEQGKRDEYNHILDLHGMRKSIHTPESPGNYWFTGEGPHGGLDTYIKVRDTAGGLVAYCDDDSYYINNFNGSWLGPFWKRHLIADMRI